MYTIESTTFGKQKAYKLVNQVSGEYVEIIPGLGGILNKFTIKHQGKFLSIIDGFISDDDFYKNNGSSFKSNKLSPFPNRIKDGKYHFNGELHELELNFPQENNSIHGLLYDVPFEVTNTTVDDKFARIELTYHYDGSSKGFDFPYTLKLVYTYGNNELACATSVINTGGKAMPYSDGWHHYFTTGTKVDMLEFTLPVTDKYLVDQQMIPTGEKEKFETFSNPKPIHETVFDDCFVLNGQSGQVKLQDPVKNITITLTPERGEGKYNFVQVYVPEDRKTIAIEPMTSPPDGLNNKEGLIELAPNESIDLLFTISVKH